MTTEQAKTHKGLQRRLKSKIRSKRDVNAAKYIDSLYLCLLALDANVTGDACLNRGDIRET
jgi:hypothetical protein